MSVQFYVYEVRDDEQHTPPRRVSWKGWEPLKGWLDEDGLEAEGQMARQFEYHQVEEVLEETAGVEAAGEDVYVAPLPDLRGATMMFGVAVEESDYVVSTVPLQWLLPQAVNGWEVAMKFTVERVGGRETEGYFNDES
ncbi:MAG: hypothetical protein ACOX9R_17570 [Armatimonadota bacterium]